jgi:hypothetical protein
MKLLITLGSFLLFTAVAAIRRAQGRKKVQMLEQGKMCVYCEGTNVVPGQTGMVCQTCGQTTLWTLIKHAPLSSAEIDKISERDRRGPFHS